MISRYETTYHLPAKLNIQRLQSLIEAKVSEAEDKLWALREDPGFFASTLWEMYQHRIEHVAGPKGKSHPGIKTTEFREYLMAATVIQVIRYCMSDVEVWGFLYTHIRSLAALKEKLFDSVEAEPKVKGDLSPELALEFYSFLYHSKQLLEPLLAKAEMRAKLSPPLMYLFRYDHNISSAETPHHKPGIVLERSGFKASSIEIEYLWVLKNMSEPTWRQNMGVHTCVEELERITSDIQGRKLLTPHLAEYFSNICILSECIYQIESFQPWAATFETAMDNEDIWNQMSQAYKRNMDKMKPCLLFSVSSDTSYLGAKLSKMKYPVDRYPNKANVDAMQAAEAALDTFWERLTIQLRQAGVWNGRIRDILLSCEPKRTPPWVEPPEKGETSTENNITSITGDIGLEKHIQGKEVTYIQPRIKEKTRPSQKPAGQEIANNVIDARLPDAKEQQLHPVFKVDKRAMKVFAMLFFQPSNSRSQLPGEIPWSNFLYAMHQVGFAVEKLGGSSWQFIPGPTLEGSGCQYARGIQFHEPHPISKIRFHMARLYGRRLTRAYGWCADTFCDQQIPE